MLYFFLTLLSVTKVGEFEGLKPGYNGGQSIPVTVPIFEWNVQDVGLLSEEDWKDFTEVEDWQEQHPGDFLKFEHEGYHMEKGLLFFITMPIGTELAALANKEELRPLMVIEGGLQRHHKPGMKFICKIFNALQSLTFCLSINFQVLWPPSKCTRNARQCLWLPKACLTPMP